MSEENKAIVRRNFEETWNKGNMAVADEIFTANYVGHDPAGPELRGPEGMKQQVGTYRTAFPNVQFSVEDQIAAGDMVATRWTARGTHQGDLMGIAPTGKQVTVTGITIERLANGKVEESWTNWDTMGMMQQLGVVPQPG